MKQVITVNQRTIVELKYPLDLVDCAIIDFLTEYTHAGRPAKKLLENTVYYSVSWDEIVTNLPLIGIQTRNGIQKRLKGLCDLKILQMHPDNQQTASSFYAFGENYEKLFFIQAPAEVQKPADVYPFEDFWNDYDRKEGKKPAAAAIWAKLKPEIKLSIKANIKAYVDTFPPDRKFAQPYPTTFLNGRYWENDSFLNPVKNQRPVKDATPRIDISKNTAGPGSFA
jgi:hypothetical protein